MLLLEQAQQLILDIVKKASSNHLVPLQEAQGFALAQSISSPINIPLFDNSAMDGYAICIDEDWSLPLDLEIIETTIGAGDTFEQSLSVGQAIRIMTGAPVPQGANTVVPIEQVESVEGRLIVKSLNKIGQHIRPEGEDFKQGQILLKESHVVNAGTIGLLATLGITEVSIKPLPRVAILSTGNELVPIDQTPKKGQIRDSNSHALAAAVRDIGAIPEIIGIAEDSREALKEQLKIAYESADIILTLGGVSVGDYDYVQEVLIDLGFQKQFWKVAVKPGKPVLFGTWNHKVVFGLPGNPGSALTVFEYLVRPAIRKMMGFEYLWRPRIKAKLRHEILKKGDRLHLMRANAEWNRDGYYEVEALKAQGSANLLIVSQANAVIPAVSSFDAGELIDIDFIRQPEDH